LHKGLRIPLYTQRIKTFASQKNELIDNFRNGREKGKKTHIRDIDSIHLE
jgi:hypothetical protein